MKNIFNSVKLFAPKENTFDLTHDVKTTMDMGWLVPTMIMDCVPGDRVNLAGESIVRMAPLIAPVMHRLDIRIEYFFVPRRIIWDNFQTWAIQLSNTTTAAPFLEIREDDPTNFPLLDYMGLPEPGVQPYLIDPTALAAYQMIVNEYYRDENLVPEINYKLVDGDNEDTRNDLITLRKRAWGRDAFTSALPFAQKGEALDIPLGRVEFDEDWAGYNVTSGDNPRWRNKDVDDGLVGKNEQFADLGGNSYIGPEGDNDTELARAYDPAGSLLVAPTTIKDLRRTEALQRYLERNALGGTRFTEWLKAIFGIKSSDARLQRPEYICGTKTPIIISEVLNTSGGFNPADPSEPSSPPQGNMAGHGIGVANGKYGTHYCEEHGYIIGITSVMPQTSYQDGIPTHFTKYDDPLKHFIPQLQHIGEQEIKIKELFAMAPNGTGPTQRDGTFGYLPRYWEYKWMQSMTTGKFKTDLAYWTFTRKFNDVPQLNQEFIECTPDKSPFAVVTLNMDSLYVVVLNKVRARRRMAKYGTPV